MVNEACIADGCSVDGVSGLRVHGTCQRSGLVMDVYIIGVRS